MAEFIERDAKEVFEEEFLDFAGYNLQRRALPDARDGLRWGARKLLHAQMLGKLTHDKPFKKAIKSVSQAMGFSYTHGNASAYGTFIRMAKPFAYRIPLQEANGNYGTLINPEDHSADRYVELRGSEAAAALLKDLEKDTITEWEDTYDMEGQFPKVLPAKGFWNGVNGCISIGSGMSSSLPPLNLGEVNEAMIRLLWNPEVEEDKILCYPDFPTGAILLNKDEIRQSLIDGKGPACKVRAEVEWDNKERCFIVRELPYSVYTNTICNELASLMDEDENCGIKDFCDYTKQKPDLRIYLSKNATPEKVLKRFYKETSLLSYFSINMTVLDRGIYPVVMGQKQLFLAHLAHEKEVYTRGFNFDLKKICDRLHIIDGLIRAISMIDEVVKTIKQSSDAKSASVALQRLLGISEIQAKAILDLKLSRLTHMDISKLENERAGLEKEKTRIEAILGDETLLKKEIEKGLREVAQKFGDERRTKILNISNEEETVEKKQLALSFTNEGAVFVSETSTLFSQRRNGVGAKFKLSKGEFIVDTLTGENVDEILFFTDKGRFYRAQMGDFAIGGKQYLSTIVSFEAGEQVRASAILGKNSSQPYIIFVTKNGVLKKSLLSEYNLKRGNGASALKLDEGDEIRSVLFAGAENIGVMSKKGYFIICPTEDIRPIGRVARGVKGMNLSQGDEVASAHLIKSCVKEIFSISSDGSAKRTSIDEFHLTNRGTKGVKIQVNEEMCDFLPLTDEKDLLIVSSSAQLRANVNEFPLLTRIAQGTKAIKLNSAKVICLSKI